MIALFNMFNMYLLFSKGAASSTTQSQIIIATQKMKKDSSDSFDIGTCIDFKYDFYIQLFSMIVSYIS